MLILDEKKIRKGKAVGYVYIGSKKQIAKKIVEIIKQNFIKDKKDVEVIDLFGGGGAITFELLINDINVTYNDIDTLPIECIKVLLNNDIEFLKSLILSREEFYIVKNKENKDIVDYIKLDINSFGYRRKSYLYGKNKADLKYKVAVDILENENIENVKRYKQTKTYKKYINKLYNDDLEQSKQVNKLLRVQQLQYFNRLNDIKNTDININKINITNLDYKEYKDVKNKIVFMDPPYKTKDKYYNHDINHEEFLNFAVELSKNNIVLITSYSIADERFECVFEFKKSRSSMQTGYHKEKYDKLFMIKNGIKKLD